MTGYTTIHATLAPLNDAPRAGATQVAQLLRGHAAHVLASDGDWLRMRGVDGYEGWTHRGYVEGVDYRATEGTVLRGWDAERRLSLGCVVQPPAGLPVPLPLGALLEADETVVWGRAMNYRERVTAFPRDGALLAARASELFAGTPYQWGGVTPWGADCSGMVQSLFALHGVPLPRDAWQQGEMGVGVENDSSSFRPADLLFFSDRDDGRVTHVALSLGGARLAHSSLSRGGFGVDSLDAEDAAAERLRAMFRFARRVLRG